MLINQATNQDRFFDDSAKAKAFFQANIAHFDREVFAYAFLTTQHQLIAFEVLFMGTINACNVHQREIIKRSLELNASALIIGHNHPSGKAEPSRGDAMLTKGVKEALRIVDIDLLDPIIVTHRDGYSFADNGRI